jgi:hypothetical protein
VFAAVLAAVLVSSDADVAYLKSLAHEVADSAVVRPGAGIPRNGKNTTGLTLRVPGGTQDYYPAFWIRDAAMMLGANLVPADEVKGWVKLVASIQPGPDGLSFPHGLRIPPYSVPDHITLDGQACWFPGAYAEQGIGQFGHLPPADDAFYFVQMVDEAFRLSRSRAWLTQMTATGWGEHPVIEVATRAFESVASDATTGLVVCDPSPSSNRVDWGFCDSISKSGSCLMPSLLRWQAANQLAQLCRAVGYGDVSKAYLRTAQQIRSGIAATFFRPLSPSEGMMISATGLGEKDDVWASAFAVWLHVLPRTTERRVATHLRNLYLAGGTVMEGQVRQLPPSGEFGGNWDSARSGGEEYQNGGFWATPTGWYVAALDTVDRNSAERMLGEYVAYVRANRAKGAPYEWINPKTGAAQNPNYASSAALVYAALLQASAPRFGS